MMKKRIRAAAMMLAMEATSPLLRPAARSVPKGPRLTAILILGLVAFSSAYAQKASAPNTQQRLTLAVNKTLEQGHDAFLPPHISHLLGISPDEQKVPVKQFAEIGQTVKGFEVSAEKHDDIVIFVENPSQGESTFYLISARGSARRVVSVKAGVGYDRAPTAADRKDLATEKQYWLDHLVPVAPLQTGKH
jgi:hypothetical protein